MITAVDTNVLIDVVIPGEVHAAASEAALGAAAAGGALVISSVVLAELAAAFPIADDLWAFIGATRLGPDPLTAEAAVLAGQAWGRYARQGKPRPRRILADFLIGAHALVQADQLLTRDRGHLRSQFPELKVVAP
ncbi:MAG: type II toxin-antitoxin system VapC family toxin [Candidatus Dormibacteria bacterium]